MPRASANRLPLDRPRHLGKSSSKDTIIHARRPGRCFLWVAATGSRALARLISCSQEGYIRSQDENKKIAARWQLVELFFRRYRQRILALLLLHPEHGYYLREIERLTGVLAGSTHRELRLLANTGLLARSVPGSQVRHQVDRTYSIHGRNAGRLIASLGRPIRSS